MSLPCLLLFHRHRLPHLTRQPEPPRRWYCSVPRGSGGTVAVRFLDPPPHKMLLRQETQNLPEGGRNALPHEDSWPGQGEDDGWTGRVTHVTLEGEIGTLFAWAQTRSNMSPSALDREGDKW